MANKTNQKTVETAKEYVSCEEMFREAVGFEYAELCNKLREVANNTSELFRLKLAAISMLRRCREDKDETACRFFRKLQNAPAWRVEQLTREYAQYLKYLGCIREYDDEKTCRRYLPLRGERRAERQSIEENLQKLPVEYVVEEDEIVVKVGRGERLSETQFKATISELKKMGFVFDSEMKVWRIPI